MRTTLSGTVSIKIKHISDSTKSGMAHVSVLSQIERPELRPLRLAQYLYHSFIMITILVTIIVVGVLLWLVNYLVPMDPKFKTVLNVLAGIFLLIWILYQFGLIGGPMPNLRVR